MTELIPKYQYYLYVIATLFGCLAVFLIAKRVSYPKKWVLIDLIWILVGGLAAAAAVSATISLEKKRTVIREYDSAFAELRILENNLNLMISSYCKMSPYVFYPFRAELTIVCDNFQHKISFLGKNQDLFYFASTLNQLNSPNDKIAPNIEVFTETWNSGELPVWANDPSQIPGSLGKPPDLDIILQDFRAESLDILKEWDSLDEGNSRACSGQDCQDRSFETDQSVIERLRSAGVYDQLIFENFRLQDDFERITDLFSKLQGKWRKALSYDIFVAFRIFTLCLIAFLLPFRVGKSLHDLNR